MLGNTASFSANKPSSRIALTRLGRPRAPILLGSSQPTLNRLENAAQNTTLKTLNKLCGALACSVGELFAGRIQVAVVAVGTGFARSGNRPTQNGLTPNALTSYRRPMAPGRPCLATSVASRSARHSCSDGHTMGFAAVASG